MIPLGKTKLPSAVSSDVFLCERGSSRSAGSRQGSASPSVSDSVGENVKMHGTHFTRHKEDVFYICLCLIYFHVLSVLSPVTQTYSKTSGGQFRDTFRS